VFYWGGELATGKEADTHRNGQASFQELCINSNASAL
jgi:hypothetical protein